MIQENALSITAPDRVLIHLRDHRHQPDGKEFPRAITQKGISEATGILLTHVPRALKGLEDRELVCSVKGHVTGERRRYKVYFLTDAGITEARAVLRFLGGLEVAGARVGDILEAGIGPVLPTLRELAGETLGRRAADRQLVGQLPDTDGFIDREHELQELGRMLDDPNNRLMVIYGSQGYGASTLASKFVRDYALDWSVAWLRVRKDLPGLVAAMSGTLAEIFPDMDIGARPPRKLVESLEGRHIILVLDGYFEADDDTVEFLQGLVSALKIATGLKLLVTARENTPAYNRFYTIMDLHDGTVSEVHIRGLDIDSCRVLLDAPDIDPDALRRLFMFTLGKPTTIKLLARGDENELRQHTSFSPQEIKLMLYLKGLKSS